jgi:hypothetical protein
MLLVDVIIHKRGVCEDDNILAEQNLTTFCPPLHKMERGDRGRGYQFLTFSLAVRRDFSSGRTG